MGGDEDDNRAEAPEVQQHEHPASLPDNTDGVKYESFDDTPEMEAYSRGAQDAKIKAYLENQRRKKSHRESARRRERERSDLKKTIEKAPVVQVVRGKPVKGGRSGMLIPLVFIAGALGLAAFVITNR